MKLTKIIMTGLCTLTLQTSLYAKTYDVTQGLVEFKARGFPTFITISGKSTKLSGMLSINEGKAEGSFKLPLASLKTGMDLRDEHMTEKYLEVEKFPEAKVTLMPFELKDSGKVMGTLTLHKVTKEIPLEYTTVKSDTGIKVSTKFKIELSDYNIQIPSFQGITVAKEINLNVDLAVREK